MLEALVMGAWLLPLAYLGLAAVGWARARSDHRTTDEPTLLILQITTVGNHDTVEPIISAIRGYGLTVPFAVWVVTEPGNGAYEGADRTLVVPPDFRCRATHKGRAMEYARRVRAVEGRGGPDVKVLFLDDDSLPTRAYVERAARADYDLCQGIVVPGRWYGRLLSHFDDVRTIECLAVCSFFQGVLGRPIWTHGEGLCVRSSAEQLVTWDHPVYASEDFVFGHKARALGLRWGFIPERIEIVSPWSMGDYFRQRRRWTWGNIEAIAHVVPVSAKLLAAGKYVLGFGAFFVAPAGTVLDLSGALSVPAEARPLLWLSMAAWFGFYGFAGWLASGGRLRHALAAAALAYLSQAVYMAVLLAGIAVGNPRRFEMIRKAPPAR